MVATHRTRLVAKRAERRRVEVMGEGSVRAIDPWVNVNMFGGGAPPQWLTRVKEDYFKAGEEFLKELSIDELTAQMDSAGVERAILSVAQGTT